MPITKACAIMAIESIRDELKILANTCTDGDTVDSIEGQVAYIEALIGFKECDLVIEEEVSKPPRKPENHIE